MRDRSNLRLIATLYDTGPWSSQDLITCIIMLHAGVRTDNGRQWTNHDHNTVSTVSLFMIPLPHNANITTYSWRKESCDNYMHLLSLFVAEQSDKPILHDIIFHVQHLVANPVCGKLVSVKHTLYTYIVYVRHYIVQYGVHTALPDFADCDRSVSV